MANSNRVKIKQILMKIQIKNNEPFFDFVSFYEVDKGYKRWRKSNLQTLANKRWGHDPNFRNVRRKVKILESKVTISEAGHTVIEA